MSEYVVVAIGNAGARVLPSLVHLSVSGHGPSALAIGFVEQDPINAPLAEGQKAIATAAAFADVLDTPVSLAHGQSLRRTLTRLISTQFNSVWRPAGAGSVLAAERRKWGESGQVGPAALLTALFDQLGKDGQDAVADDFGGAADLAAFTVSVAGDLTSNAFWSVIKAKIDRATAANPVRFALVGASYEPLGAAGLEIARHIMRLVEDAGAEDGVDIGMVTLTGHEVGDADQARRSRAALHHYARTLNDDPLVQRLYVTGWDPLFDPASSRGAATPADLLAALAILDHFEAPFEGAQGDEPVVALSFRREATRFDWRDIDTAWRGSGASASHGLSQLLAFAYAWRSHFSPEVQIQARKRMGRSGWYKALCGDIKVGDAGDDDAALAAVDAYVDHLLGWAAGLAAARPKDDVAPLSAWSGGMIDALLGAGGGGNGAMPSEPGRLEDLFATSTDAPHHAVSVDGLVKTLENTPQNGLAQPPVARLVRAIHSGVLAPGAPIMPPLAGEEAAP